jgi:hypothetical protein
MPTTLALCSGRLDFLLVADAMTREIDRLVGAATPHFAYQLRARVLELIAELPDDHPTRRYGEQRIELLDRLGHASSKATEGEPEPRSRIGWSEIPSSAPASSPHPKRS